MATTRIAMEIKKYSRISFTYSIASSGHPSLLSTMINMITKTIKMARADTKPNIEISLANFSNFNYNGVNSSSLAIKSSIFPIEEFLPTFIMRILPVPVKTFVPANKTFDDIVWCLIVFQFYIQFIFYSKHLISGYFFIGSVSPVIELSSI